jgi:hypothetical protein
MVSIQLQQGQATFEVQGFHKVWALKGSITVPTQHITFVERLDKSRHRVSGIRMPGTHVPTIITAGTYLTREGTHFWDVVNPEKSIVVHLKHEKYTRLLLEVDDVDAALNLLNALAEDSAA